MRGKWYRSKGTKTILLAMEHVFAAFMVAACLFAFAYPYLAVEVLPNEAADVYEDSYLMRQSIQRYSEDALQSIDAKALFETKGKYDPNKIVDIETFCNSYTVSGKNTSGFAYYIDDLLNPGNYSHDELDEMVVVCKKADNTYYYYRYKDFQEKVNVGELVLKYYGNGDYTLEEYLNVSTYGGAFTEQGEEIASEDESGAVRNVENKTGKVLYVDCWLYDGSYTTETCSPIGAKDILEVVNENPHWNGRLSEAYEYLANATANLREQYQLYLEAQNYLEEGDTNYSYIYADTKKEKVYTNRSSMAEYENLDESLEAMKRQGRYVIVTPTLDSFETNFKNIDASTWKNIVTHGEAGVDGFIFAAAVDTKYPIHDEFYTAYTNYETYREGVCSIIGAGVVSVIGFLIIFIWLTLVAGRNTEDEELHLCRIDYWKTEIAAAIFLFVGIGLITIGGLIFVETGNFIGSHFYDGTGTKFYAETPAFIVIITVCVVAGFAVLLTGYLSLVRRIKARLLWKDSILRWGIKKTISFTRYVYGNIGSLWRVLAAFGLFLLLHWILISAASYGMKFAIPVVAAEGVALVYLIKYVIGREKIKKGICEIADGNVDYKISTEKMFREHKEIAEQVNHIGNGMEAAVEKSMKSERLKTDLITNVSHDIKTPLTSIINYVDLLKKEQFEDPKIQHYLDVLEQKSQRLKTLTEDVVEASKVSSGNVSLERMKLNFVEMIQQTSGEFEEKFSARGLKEIQKLPEKEVLIYVDGRRTWRVLENIYNNAAKYAMGGSRVYVELREEGRKAILTIKNISEQPLNISADELTERFIRGDISRSTEGSGLGISIAKSLTELQGGRFEIYLDGDLFKVTVEFPTV